MPNSTCRGTAVPPDLQSIYAAKVLPGQPVVAGDLLALRNALSALRRLVLRCVRSERRFGARSNLAARHSESDYSLVMAVTSTS